MGEGRSYAGQLEALLRSRANPEQAAGMEAYMREQFPFLGIKTPEREALTKVFLKEHGVPSGDTLEEAVRALWRLPEREFQYTAMALLDKRRKDAGSARIDLLEELVTAKSWWDTVDLLAARLIGNHFTLYPEQIPGYTGRWLDSGNLWPQRSVLLFQLGYKKRTDTALLFGAIRHCADSKEFFIRKAIGWALREYSKTDEAAVRAFVAETPLSPLSVREALKYADRQGNT
ncbi:DNA alkylation repair protein [Paenibacillus sp. P25]|nr:DNA alkylation repair protein [Paenibacillus sp. P25]